MKSKYTRGFCWDEMVTARNDLYETHMRTIAIFDGKPLWGKYLESVLDYWQASAILMLAEEKYEASMRVPPVLND